jgi:flagellar protein FliO/FliZ
MFTRTQATPALATQAAGMFAAPQAASSPHPVGVGGLGEVAFALIVVLAAIFVIAWVVRRMRLVGNRVGGAIDVLADVPLGQKERAVLLKVGTQQILLGVAPGRVNTLHVLAEPIDLTKPPAGGSGDSAGNTFRNVLMRSLGK